MSCCGQGRKAAQPCCCGQASGSCDSGEKKMEVKNAVREGYGKIAETAPQGATEATTHIAKAMGYTDEQLAQLPDGANMGLQCGNPTALAALKPGERVVDLGSGGGLDVFLASKKVGPTGRAVGLDMTLSMVRRARAAALKANITNVEFTLGEMENMPFSDGEFDCCISNCVINLSPDKDAVFREVYRILKPGGRLCVSDMALKRPLPTELRDNVQAVVGCVGNAILVGEYVAKLKAAGFAEVAVVDSNNNLNAYFEKPSSLGLCGSSCCGAAARAAGGADGPLAAQIDVLRRHDLNEFVASYKITAFKPS